MTGLPQAAINATARWLHDDECNQPHDRHAEFYRDRARAVLEAAAPHIAAAERERWRSLLTEHYLMGINCDPETKRDNPMCGCSRIHLGWYPSAGAARQAWIDHVTDLPTGAEGTAT